jgi:hypothetical protein
MTRFDKLYKVSRDSGESQLRQGGTASTKSNPPASTSQQVLEFQKILTSAKRKLAAVNKEIAKSKSGEAKGVLFDTRLDLF